MGKPTRQSIKDKQGYRSLYVVEGMSATGHMWPIAALVYCTLASAVAAKHKLKKEWPQAPKIRIALYVRAEDTDET